MTASQMSTIRRSAVTFNAAAQGVYVLMSGLDYERLVLSAGPLGIMQVGSSSHWRFCSCCLLLSGW